MNSGNNLYKAHMKGSELLVIVVKGGYKLYTKVSIKQWVG
jgi:hypothetical protein